MGSHAIRKQKEATVSRSQRLSRALVRLSHEPTVCHLKFGLLNLISCFNFNLLNAKWSRGIFLLFDS